jgi:hypothetical protein
VVELDVVVGVERERRWRSPRLLGGLIVVKREMVCGGWLGVGRVVAGYYIHVEAPGVWVDGAGSVAF